LDYNNYRYILAERRGRILALTLNRPERLNAITPEMHTELSRIFEDIRRDAAVDVVTITGAGRGFCAGADLKEPAAGEEVIDTIFAEAREILLHILELDRPIISAVNGPATGLGVTLALFADIVIASDRARLGDTHVKVGLTAGDGGAVIWPLLVGVNKAKELLMTGEVIDAHEALKIGLVNYVVPHEELESIVMKKAEELAAGNAMAIRSTKKAVNLYIKWMLNQVFDYSCAMEHQCARQAVSFFQRKER
jgi:enoyl-CoA hydratase